MPPDRGSEVARLYHAALEREPDDRTAFLNQACSDEQLRREVESLLQHEQKGDQLLRNRSGQFPRAMSIGMRVGPYEIISAIGAGGMGEVYAALDTRLDRRVAIKVSSQQFIQRFEREARAIAALNHPHVCTVHDVGPNYLVMELVEGETLGARLHKGPLSYENVIRYGIEIAALSAAHEHAIVHRDLKPSNIMLTRSGVTVLDFGLAKFARPDGAANELRKLTGNQEIVGTLAYMAPEQLAGRECDACTDIYSFGLVLHEMLTGKPTLRDESTLTLDHGAASTPEVDATPLDRVIRKCLATDSEERWQSARDLKTNLEGANRTPGAEQGKKPSKHALHSVWAIAAAALAIAALGGWFIWPKNELMEVHFIVSPPEGTRIAMRMPGKPLVAPAPDGKKWCLSLKTLQASDRFGFARSVRQPINHSMVLKARGWPFGRPIRSSSLFSPTENSRRSQRSVDLLKRFAKQDLAM